MPESSAGFPILTALVLVPVAGALAVALTGKRRPELVKLIGLLASVFTAAMSIWLMVKFDTGNDGFQFVSKHSWISAWGISWHLGVDGISLFLVVLTGRPVPAGDHRRRRRTTTRSRTWPGCSCSRPA